LLLPRLSLLSRRTLLLALPCYSLAPPPLTPQTELMLYWARGTRLTRFRLQGLLTTIAKTSATPMHYATGTGTLQMHCIVRGVADTKAVNRLEAVHGACLLTTAFEAQKVWALL
jgi:hypothetical protein